MDRRPVVYLVSCLKLPEPDPDEALLSGALAAAGVSPHVRAWDDPAVDWSVPRAAIIRSTWNYHLDRDGFLAWVARASAQTKLYNAPELVVWNSHKSYLADLERRGFAIVPTWFVSRGSNAALWSECASRGWTDVVVKPTVSGGSFSTRRFSTGEGQEFFAQLVAARDVMVQPYIRSVDGYGERSILWIAGEFTHAIRKTPRFAGSSEEVSAALPIAPEEQEFAAAVLASVGPGLLYARVDLARDENNRPMLMELEVIEPSLFLQQSPAALSKFAAAIRASVSSPAP